MPRKPSSFISPENRGENAPVGSPCELFWYLLDISLSALRSFLDRAAAVHHDVYRPWEKQSVQPTISHVLFLSMPMQPWKLQRAFLTTGRILILTCVLFASIHPAWSQFRLAPYVQDVSESSIAIVWWSADNREGLLEWGPTSAYGQTTSSIPRLGSAISTVLDGVELPDSHPYRHEVKLSSLQVDTPYHYRVTQGAAEWIGQFTTAVGPETGFTFVIAADPESKATQPIRNDIHRALLRHISSKTPRFLVYAGDLVDQGNAQDDWDSYWSDLVQGTPADSLASAVPVYAALGNHEYDGLNTTLGGNGVPYAQPFSETGVARHLEYFSFPENNHAPGDPRRKRYYSFKYGPATVIVLDTNHDSISTVDPGTRWDTGRYSGHPLVGENEAPEPGGQGFAPDIHGGVSGESDSLQYQWLVETLQQASTHSAFIFVVNHQAPFSSFVHGAPDEQQSGYPLRKLDGLFHHYSVDAVFSGHDESYERSVTRGTEAGGPAGVHEIHYFVLPTIGDPSGLRDPVPNATWQEGFSQYIYPLDNKHFGYLGVDIEYQGDDHYLANITPYYLNLLDPTNPDAFYDDIVQIPGMTAK